MNDVKLPAKHISLEIIFLNKRENIRLCRISLFIDVYETENDQSPPVVFQFIYNMLLLEIMISIN